MLIEGRLAGVDQDVVIAAAKGLDALMNPDGLHLCAQCIGQLTNHPAIFRRFDGGRVRSAKFGVDLNFGGETISKTGVEEKGIHRHPIIYPAVEHGSRPLAGIRRVLKGGRIAGDDDVWVKKNGAVEWGNGVVTGDWAGAGFGRQVGADWSQH